MTTVLPRKTVVSDAYQPHDLLGMSNADDVIDDLLRDLDSDTPLRVSKSIPPQTKPIEMDSVVLAGAVGVRDSAAGTSEDVFDEQTNWMVAENQAVSKEVDEMFREVREPNDSVSANAGSRGGLDGPVQKGPVRVELAHDIADDPGRLLEALVRV